MSGLFDTTPDCNTETFCNVTASCGKSYKKAQLSLTNLRDTKACQKLLKFDMLICTFRLVTNSNFGRISYRFRVIDTLNSKIACFPTAPLFDAL